MTDRVHAAPDHTRGTNPDAPEDAEPPGSFEDSSSAGARRIDVLGVGVSDISLDSVGTDLVDFLGRQDGSRGYVCVTGVHGVIEAQDDPGFRDILNDALYVTPDGVPLLWMGRYYGRSGMTRVYGPDLMLEVFRRTEGTDVRHFFYGGKEGVAALLAEKLREKYPGTVICGTYTPPFRPLDEDEEREFLGQLESSGADVLWVGLSTPKQERFMAEWIDKVPAKTRLLFGVGAAFDFHAGLVSQAPRWIQNCGLEWLYRLCQEPKRLWPRYRKINPRFLRLILPQLIAGKRR